MLMFMSGMAYSETKDKMELVKEHLAPLEEHLPAEFVQAVQTSIVTLTDGLPSLFKMLDDVSQIHPFVSGTFCTVWGP